MPAPDLNVQTPGDPNANTSSTSTTAASQATTAYAIEHRGGGRYVVIDNNAELVDGKTVKIGDFIGTKAEALAEVDRLNAGGAPFVSTDDADLDQAQEQPTTAASQAIDPTTLKAPTLTEHGWLCPEK